MANTLENLMHAMEKQVDNEIQKLCTADEDDLEKIRRDRLCQMKKRCEENRTLLGKGRGKLDDLNRESDFFDICGDNPRIITYFYTDVERSATEIIKKKMMELAIEHLETKFLAANVSKCGYLAKKLDVEKSSGIILVIDGKIFGPLKCEIKLTAHAKEFVESLEQKLKNFGAIDVNVEKEERQAMAKSLRSSIKKRIRDMDAEFLSQLSD